MKCHKLVEKSHKTVNLRDKIHKLVQKSHKYVNLCDKKSSHIEKKTQNCKFLLYNVTNLGY